MAAISNTTVTPAIKKSTTPPTAAVNTVKVKAADTTPAPLAVNTTDVFSYAPNTAKDAVLLGMNVGRLATMPVIGNIIISSVKSGINPSNILWSGVPSAFRNVKAVAAHKESAGRGAANVTTEVGFSVAKGIMSSIAVQAVSVATGPLLGAITIPAAILPFVGVGISLGTMFLAYKGMNALIKHTHIDQKVADGLTKIFGGDLKPTTAAATTTPAKAAN